MTAAPLPCWEISLSHDHSQVLCFPFYSDCWERGEPQREVGSPVLLPVCALAESTCLGGEGSRAVQVLSEPSGSAEPRGCQGTTPSVSMEIGTSVMGWVLL